MRILLTKLINVRRSSGFLLIKYALLFVVFLAVVIFFDSKLSNNEQPESPVDAGTRPNPTASESAPDSPVPDSPAPDSPESDTDTSQNTDTSQQPADDEQVEPPSSEEAPDRTSKVNGVYINFNSLIRRDAGNRDLVRLHEYFKSLKPSGQNEKTGIYEGYNLITISAEAFTPYFIDPELTPTLYMMQQNGIYLNNFYGMAGGGTIGGEVSLITGFFPEGGHGWSHNAARKHLPFTFASQFRAMGIQPLAYHNGTYTFYDRHILHPNLGYIFRTRRHGLDFKGPGWHMSDKILIELSIDQYIDMDRFYVHYMTVSGHSPYSWENGVARMNREAVNHLSYSPQVKAYVATQMELEYALEYLLERLEEKGIAEQTLIVMTTDHYPYGLSMRDNAELAGQPFDSAFGLFKNACFIYVKGMDPMTIEAPAFVPDIVPTVSNLLGLNFDSRFMSGRDVFSDAMPLIYLNCGFMTDVGYYEKRLGKFTPFEEVEVPEGYVAEMLDIVSDRRAAIEQAIRLDYFSKIADYLKPPGKVPKWGWFPPE